MILQEEMLLILEINMTVRLRSCVGLSSTTRVICGGRRCSCWLFKCYRLCRILLQHGNATDFGDLTVVRGWPTGVSNNTRGVFAGGYTFSAPASTYYNQMDYITIASTGKCNRFWRFNGCKKY